MNDDYQTLKEDMQSKESLWNIRDEQTKHNWIYRLAALIIGITIALTLWLG